MVRNQTGSRTANRSGPRPSTFPATARLGTQGAVRSSGPRRLPAFRSRATQRTVPVLPLSPQPRDQACPSRTRTHRRSGRIAAGVGSSRRLVLRRAQSASTIRSTVQRSLRSATRSRTGLGQNRGGVRRSMARSSGAAATGSTTPRTVEAGGVADRRRDSRTPCHRRTWPARRDSTCTGDATSRIGSTSVAERAHPAACFGSSCERIVVRVINPGHRKTMGRGDSATAFPFLKQFRRPVHSAPTITDEERRTDETAHHGVTERVRRDGRLDDMIPYTLP
ncbi:hypothetical protein SAMN06265360_115124 [Haloechinothrix alba]|uniref:Uncharacterized protein n=1 Tax=Haloechinothrix alba TaxID=664784 RepID=A0A238YL00_9PSEU|nr:hypothetical protein SAMN06265360_115124 [Haloechinothrix alba]